MVCSVCSAVSTQEGVHSVLPSVEEIQMRNQLGNALPLEGIPEGEGRTEGHVATGLTGRTYALKKKTYLFENLI